MDDDTIIIDHMELVMALRMIVVLFRVVFHTRQAVNERLRVTVREISQGKHNTHIPQG